MLRASVSLGLGGHPGHAAATAIVWSSAWAILVYDATDTVAGAPVLRASAGGRLRPHRYRDCLPGAAAAARQVKHKYEPLLANPQIRCARLFAAIVVWIAACMAVAGSLTPGGLHHLLRPRYLSRTVDCLRDYTRHIVSPAEPHREVAPAAGSLIGRLDLDPAAAHPVGDLVTGSGLTWRAT